MSVLKTTVKKTKSLCMLKRYDRQSYPIYSCPHNYVIHQPRGLYLEKCEDLVLVLAMVSSLSLDIYNVLKTEGEKWNKISRIYHKI